MLFTIFVVVELWQKENALVPPHILKNRSVAFGFCYAIAIGSAFVTMIYYLPIWFQAIKGVSAVKSGIMNLPTLISVVLASIMSGILVSKFGYYVPAMIAGTILISTGAGLITSFTPETNHSKWIGYQVILGLGIGCALQQAGVAAQTVLPRKDVPTGLALMFFGQFLGGATFISVAQNIFTNRLVSALSSVPNFDPRSVVNVGATDLRRVVEPDNLVLVLSAYNYALTKAFVVALALACCSAVGAAGMEWKSVKYLKEAQMRAAKVAAEKAAAEKAAAEKAAAEKAAAEKAAAEKAAEEIGEEKKEGKA